MAATSPTDKPTSFFGRPQNIAWLIVGYFILSVILRLLRSDALQPDEAEQIFQSQFLLMGYGRQPPFYNWLQMGMFELMGPSIAALSILKNLLLCLACGFFGLAARIVLKDREMAAAAMLGVLTMPATIVMVQRDLTHAVATFCFVALFLLAFFRTLTRPSLGAYLATGIFVGLGIITKYNFVILPVAAIIAALADAEMRKRIFDWRLAPALAVAALICLPHMLWVFGNLETATSGTIEAMREDGSGNALLDRVEGVLSIATSALEGAIPTLIFFAIAFPRQIRDVWQAQNRWTRLTGIILIASLAIVAVIALGFGASSIRQKWLAPFLMVFPLYLCLKLDAAGAKAQDGLPRLAVAVLSVAALFAVYLYAANALGPRFGKFGKETMPYRAFVARVLADSNNEHPAIFVSDATALVGAARILVPDARAILPGDGSLRNDLPAEPHGMALVIWTSAVADMASPTAPSALMKLLATNGQPVAEVPAKTLTVPYQFSDGAKSATFGYAWVPALP